MALPSQLAGDDQPLVDEIVRSIPGADDPKRVRSLLAAWWRYAGVRNAAGAVVDSERFLAERSSLGLLELPVAIARSVIELEFALLHNPKGMVALAPAPPPAPPPVVHEPRPVVQTPVVVEPAPAAAPLPVVEEARPVLALAPIAANAPAIIEPQQWETAPTLAAPVRVSEFELFQRDRMDVADDPETTPTTIMAVLVVFFSLAIGLALVAGGAVPHLPIPGGDAASLIAPWRAWLAALAGAAGVVVATVIARRRTHTAAALRAPRIGLGGLAVTGIGLLGGSLIATGAGGVVLLGGSLLTAVARR